MSVNLEPSDVLFKIAKFERSIKSGIKTYEKALNEYNKLKDEYMKIKEQVPMKEQTKYNDYFNSKFPKKLQNMGIKQGKLKDSKEAAEPEQQPEVKQEKESKQESKKSASFLLSPSKSSTQTMMKQLKDVKPSEMEDLIAASSKEPSFTKVAPRSMSVPKGKIDPEMRERK